MAEIGVPTLYRRHRMADFEIQATIPAGVMRFGALDWSHGGFLLRGSYGQGKSCFAGALVRSMLHHEAPAGLLEQNEYTGVWNFRRGSVRWWHASELSNWILDESFAGRRRAMYEELMTPRLVVLDDYGKERMQTDVVREAMVTAIERWTSNGRLLIVTTNLATDEDLINHEPANASRLDALPEIILPPLDRRGAFKEE